jgi:hypothetical protein
MQLCVLQVFSVGMKARAALVAVVWRTVEEEVMGSTTGYIDTKNTNTINRSHFNQPNFFVYYEE